MPEQLQLKALEEQLKLLIEKLAFLRERRLIETDASVQFKLDYEISELEQRQIALKRQLTLQIGIATPSDDGMLKALIKDLQMERDKIGVLYMVNCNRDELADLFWDKFDEKEGLPTQFYFIPASPNQMPPSFAERMIWEVLQDELDEEMDAISIELAADGLRLKTANFEVRNKLERTQKAFKKYFCKRFDEGDFDKLIGHVLPQRNYQYVATMLRVELSEWREFMPEFLQWLIDTFQAASEEVDMSYLFFVVVNMQDFVDVPLTSEQEAILASIRSVIDTNTIGCSKLKGLSPVPSEDLEKWFRDVGEQNPEKINKVIQNLIAGLSAEKQAQFNAKSKLDMADIELLQRLVYEVANE